MQPSVRKTPYKLQVAGPQDLFSIHEATLDVLWETGAIFEDSTAVELLTAAGAVSEGAGRVRIPPYVVERAIETAPSSFCLYSRDGQVAMKLEPGHVHCGTGSDCPYVIDHDTGQRRQAVKRDIEVFSRLSDALPNIDFVMTMALASDYPASTADLHHFLAMVENTTKPVCFTAVKHENLVRICQLAATIAGSKQALQEHPFLFHYAMPSPPLRHSATALQNLLHCAQQSIPVVYGSGTAMGLTGPMTIAGATVSSNADILSGLVAHQLANPGAPFIYGAGVTVFDMKTMIDSYGAPEHHLGDALNGQLVHHYGLPSWGYAADTDSKVLDLQAGVEFVSATFMGMLSNFNLLHDVGYMESGLTASCESILLGNEVIENVRRMLQPIVINDETLGVASIKNMGPGGSFVAEGQTLKCFRDIWYSPLIDRRRYGDWASLGSLTMHDRLRSRVQDLLDTHQPAPLEPQVAKRIASRLDEWERQSA
jgi:trimethylamine--corrinoid protein Co-methyltransferase